ncbi:GIY-YIG nuclease family protein [Agromyces allii]|uniref:GIY-YIG nuclease family protein n=1 Tax=Agromyces allii TaxID=393607 RepID=A0ABN2Q629_9MICO|nr:GIY-YIG nuclease family protein [Agromyces allii]
MEGFSGSVRFDLLPSVRVPTGPGVYVVVRESDAPPAFLETNPAGWFKGKNPTLPVGELERAWVPAASVIYIGKATNLRRRLSEYRRHGAGQLVGHWGGRMIWQLADSADLRVSWRETPDVDPESVESGLLADFAAEHGTLPFANRKGGKAQNTRLPEQREKLLRLHLESCQRDAQRAWDAGRPFFTTRIPLDDAVVAPGLAREHDLADSSVALMALQLISSIGWQIHTWAVTEPMTAAHSGRLIDVSVRHRASAYPLFTRGQP